jgi:hypothetical protein
LNGEDLNQRSDASASRWVIDFNERSEASAATYELPFRRVSDSVRPERLSNVGQAVREYPWWRHWRPRPALRAAIANLDETLVLARVSKAVMPVRIATGSLPSDQVVVFATDSYSVQAVLSSSVHQLWAITYGSTLETRVRYTPSDVFDTMPRPDTTKWLDQIGRALDGERHKIMLQRDLGLTKMYNLVNDPNVADTCPDDIARIRAIHVELDQAVMDAYGWSDVPLKHGFHTYRQMQRWTVSPAARVEILDRLLEENHRRAAEEAAQAKPSAKGRKAKAAPNAGEALFS